MQYSYKIGRDGFTVRFDGKPSEAVRNCLKRHGMRWSPGAQLWWRSKITGAADVIKGINILLGREADAVDVEDGHSPMGGVDVDLAYEDQCRDACGL